jgi:hypothetical protein
MSGGDAPELTLDVDSHGAKDRSTFDCVCDLVEEQPEHRCTTTCKVAPYPGELIDEAEVAWARGKRTYGVVMLGLGFVVFGSFLPAVIAWLIDSTWYMNVVRRDFVNPFQWLISAHALTALFLLAMLIAQVYTALTGKPGDMRRTYHRFVGKYVGALIMVSALFALAAETAANICCQEAGFMTLILMPLITITLGLGLRAAKEKRYAEHKDYMMWLVLIIASTGTVRFMMYILNPLMKCDPFLSDWPILLAVILSAIIAFLCLRSIGRIGLRYKTNLVYFGVHALYIANAAVSVALFECPAVQTPINATAT